MQKKHEKISTTATSGSASFHWGLAASLATLAFSITVHIELLNQRADCFLPRTIPEHGNPKWRGLLWTTEAKWKEVVGPIDVDGRPLKRLLTNAEENQMRTDINHAKARNNLLNAVETWGLWNYLIAPALLYLAMRKFHASLKPTSKCVALFLVSMGLLCGTLTLYRGYFTSLGH